MVISLYICEIPRNVDKSDLEDLFKSMDGYCDTRMKPTNDNRKISFVDFREEKQAAFALNTLQGFKFSPEDKGIMIKISENTKGGGLNQSRREGHSTKRRRDRSDSYRRERRHREESPQSERKSGPPKDNNITNNNNILDLISILSNTSANQSLIKPNFPVQNTSENNIDPNSISNILECLQNLQTVQLFSSIANPSSESSHYKKETNTNTNNNSNTKTKAASSFSRDFFKFDDYFKSSVEYRRNATNIVYVEGLPNDTTEREVAHVFRPFPGFRSVRLITREKNGQKSLICFADFDEVYQSTIVINTLQGYRFDKSDLVGLHFSYGVNKIKDRRK